MIRVLRLRTRRISELRGDLLEAAHRWQSVQQKFANMQGGFVRGADCLRRAGRLEAAGALLDEAACAVSQPSAAPCWEGATRAAQRQPRGCAAPMGGHPGGVQTPHRRAARHRKVPAGTWSARRGRGGAGGRLSQLPHQWRRGVRICAVRRTTSRLGRSPASLGVGARPVPQRSRGHAGCARTLRQQRRLEEAEAALQDGLRQFPDAIALLLEHARLASQRRDWPQAVQRWEAVRALSPDLAEMHRRLAEASAALASATAA